jgi:hypothetical protein
MLNNIFAGDDHEIRGVISGDFDLTNCSLIFRAESKNGVLFIQKSTPIGITIDPETREFVITINASDTNDFPQGDNTLITEMQITYPDGRIHTLQGSVNAWVIKRQRIL